MKQPKDKRTLREQITAYLERHADATAKQIGAHTTERRGAEWKEAV